MTNKFDEVPEASFTRAHFNAINYIINHHLGPLSNMERRYVNSLFAHYFSETQPAFDRARWKQYGDVVTDDKQKG